MDMNQKLMKNQLMSSKLYRLTKEEKHEIVTELLKDNTQRGLATELGIPRSTIQDWFSLRQDNTEEGIHVSLSLIYRKVVNLEAKDVADWGRLEMINEKCEDLLRNRPSHN